MKSTKRKKTFINYFILFFILITFSFSLTAISPEDILFDENKIDGFQKNYEIEFEKIQKIEAKENYNGEPIDYNLDAINSLNILNPTSKENSLFRTNNQPMNVISPEFKDEYALIQIKNNKDFNADYQELINNNVEFLESYPNNLFLVKVPDKELNLEINSLNSISNINKQNKIHEKLKEKITDNEIDSIDITIHTFEPITLEQYNEFISISNEILYFSSPNDLITVNFETSKIEELLEKKHVKFIYEHKENKLHLDSSNRVINADFVRWNGVDASGSTVGIIDSGIQTNHPHFSSTTIYHAHDYADNDEISNAVCGESSCSDGNDNDFDGRVDEGTHGVHVAGIISGEGVFNQRTFTGISNNAALTIERVFDAEGVWQAPSSGNDAIWEEILDPDGDNYFYESSSADIISCSWGHGDGEYDASSERVDEVIMGEHSGGKKVLVIMSAGNDGHTSTPKIGAPGTAKNALTVGASADFRNNLNLCSHWWSTDPNDLYIMEYSSRGTDFSGHVKPDILAPGSDITSTVLGSSYLTWDGTSMATPHVSAVAAQIHSHYAASPDLIRAMIIGNADGGGTTNNKNYDQAWGRLNAFSSVYKLSDEIYDSYGTSSVGNSKSGRPTEVYYTVDVPSNSGKFIVTLAYSDDPGDPFFGGLLYNDLDLYLEDPNGVKYFEDDDDVNTIEKYKINNPMSGTWRVYIKAISLNDNLGLSSKEVSFAVSMRVIKPTQTPSVSLDAYANYYNVRIGNFTEIFSTFQAHGYEVNDAWTDIDISSGLTLFSPYSEGTDNDKFVYGIFPPGINYYVSRFVLCNELGTQTVKFKVYGNYRDMSTFYEEETFTINVKKDDGDLCSANSECFTGYCEGSQSYSARCCRQAPTSDGQYCSSGNIQENRDYYCDSGGYENYQVISTLNCGDNYCTDSGDSWTFKDHISDFNGCQNGNCVNDEINYDYCVGDVVYDRQCGTSDEVTPDSKNCNDFDGTDAYCDVSGSNLYRKSENWYCDDGACKDTGNDQTEQTWSCSAANECNVVDCLGTNHYCLRSNQNQWTWSTNPPTETNCNDGYDNDCDGNIDTQDTDCAACTNGQTRNCPNQVGVCAGSVETCTNNNWPGCGFTEYNHNGDYESPETSCDNKDNDCDGQTDENFPTLGVVCGVGVGECEESGNLVCNAAGDDVECSAVPGNPVPEVCDNLLDDDCDFLIDDNDPDCNLITYTHPLKEGWNLVSPPILGDFDTIMNTLEGNYDKFFTYSGYNVYPYWEMYDPNDEAHSNLGILWYQDGIWINMLHDFNFTIEGREFGNFSFRIYEGLNLISYPYLADTNVVSLFAFVISNVNIVYYHDGTNWFVYNPNEPTLQTLYDIYPGYALWIDAKHNETWDFIDGRFYESP